MGLRERVFAAFSASIRGTLTSELKEVHSSVRAFIEERFGAGLPAVQRG